MLNTLTVFLKLFILARFCRNVIANFNVTDQTSLIQQKILDNLGYSAIPARSEINVSVTDVNSMLKQYHALLDELEMEEKNHKKETIKTYHVFKETGTFPARSATKWWKTGKNLYFNVSTLKYNKAQQVFSAKLKIFKAILSPITSEEDDVHVNVYLTTKPGDDVRLLLASRPVSIIKSGWEFFDVTQAVELWTQSNITNYGLQIDCLNQPTCQTIYFIPANVRYRSKLLDEVLINDFKPTLSVLTSEWKTSPALKAKRGGFKEETQRVEDCHLSGNNRLCCRKKLYVSFEDIGWNDWVFAPTGYEAYFCEGRCPNKRGRLYKAGNTHATIQAAIHRQNSNIPKPCCTAKRLRPLPMLHLDNSVPPKIVITQHNGMIVDECACS